MTLIVSSDQVPLRMHDLFKKINTEENNSSDSVLSFFQKLNNNDMSSINANDDIFADDINIVDNHDVDNHNIESLFSSQYLEMFIFIFIIMYLVSNNLKFLQAYDTRRKHHKRCMRKVLLYSLLITMMYVYLF